MDEIERERLTDAAAILQRIQQNERLNAIQQELSKTRRRQDQESEKPQCPACGGRLAGEFRKCQHCACDLIWSHGIPGELGQEDALAAIVEKMQRKAAAKEAQQSRLLAMPWCERCRNRFEEERLTTSNVRGLSNTTAWPVPIFGSRKVCRGCLKLDESDFMTSWVLLFVTVVMTLGVVGCLASLN